MLLIVQLEASTSRDARLGLLRDEIPVAGPRLSILANVLASFVYSFAIRRAFRLFLSGR